jgi:mannose-6-phosphate isomerase
MSDLYPLLLKPEFSPRPWGARDLSPIYMEFPGTPGELIGESWLTGDKCKVANGPLAGKTLADVVKQYGRELVGETAPQADHFPLLMKFIFPKDKLSVQVHPDDEGARKTGEPCGKNECWYVLAAEPGAQIGLGLKPGTTHEEFERAIKEVRAESLLNWIDVKPGEMYFVDAGTVHAIAAGSILVETQQNSDLTFRLYDYGRLRELHIKQGLEAVRAKTHAGKVLNGKAPVLVASPWFVVEKHSVRGAQAFELGASKSAQCLVAIGGCGVIESPGSDPVTFACGEAVVIPASVRGAAIRPQWEVEFIRASVPAGEVAMPQTTLVSSAEARA